jgi:peptidoglycan/LPS O-acetylase OafA/YrhL
MNIISPKGFLQVGGAVLVLLAILGFIGVLGPTPDQSLFGEAWYFTPGENWTHLILGVVALAAVYLLKNAETQRLLVMAVGALGLIVGVLNFFLSTESPNFLGANLENPMDAILHIVVGAWGLWASMQKETTMATAPIMPPKQF